MRQKRRTDPFTGKHYESFLPKKTEGTNILDLFKEESMYTFVNQKLLSQLQPQQVEVILEKVEEESALNEVGHQSPWIK